MAQNPKFILGLLVLAVLPAAAGERVPVRVVCELAEHRYRINLTDDQINRIDTDCAAGLAETLQARIGFLEFVAGTPADNTLSVRIGKSKEEADPNAFRPVEFSIELSGGDVAESGSAVSWPFRTVEEFLQIPSADTFADAIRVRFAEGLQLNEQQLIGQQLGRLVITKSAWPMPTERSWLLQLSREELCLADNSELRIRAALVFPDSEERFTYSVRLFGDFNTAPGVPPQFHHSLKALQLPGDDLPLDMSLQRLQSADDIQISYVVVSRYVPAVAPARTSPTGLDVSAAGVP